MNKLISGTKNLFLSKQQTILSSAAILAVMIVFSRLFGFLRYRVLAGYFVKEELDLFFASFRIPDLVFEVLISGALTTSFIPLFVKYQKSTKELNLNISSIINIITMVLFAFVILLVLFAHIILPYITPGFTPEQVDIVIYFTRILLIGQLPFLVFANFLTGIGQANKTFILSAVAPIAYNVVIILATIFLSSSFHLLAPVLGVVAGSMILLIVQLPLYFTASYVYSPVIAMTEGLREFFRVVLPRIVTVIAAQIDATVDLTLASMLGAGSYTIFYLAQHLQLLPVSVIGIAFGQASLPYLSELYQNNKMQEFKKIITGSILSTLFLTVPIASFFIFARTPLVRLFFGGARFDWYATNETALALSYFAISIPSHSVYYFLTRCYYAFLDSKTPFIVSVVSILLNTALSLLFVFVYHLPVWALAASFSIAICVNVLLLLIILSVKISGLDLRLLLIESVKILVATFVSSFFAYAFMKVLDGLILDTSRTINVFLLLVFGGVSHLLLFTYLSWTMGVREFSLIGKLLLKAKDYRRKVVEIYTAIE